MVEWLAKQPYCHEAVAMWGGSYGESYSQWATAKEKPPHLVSIVPASAPYLGVDFPMQKNIFSTFDSQTGLPIRKVTPLTRKSTAATAFGLESIGVGRRAACRIPRIRFVCRLSLRGLSELDFASLRRRFLGLPLVPPRRNSRRCKYHDTDHYRRL